MSDIKPIKVKKPVKKKPDTPKIDINQPVQFITEDAVVTSTEKEEQQ